MSNVLAQAEAEMLRQTEIFGEQNHPDGTGRTGDSAQANFYRELCDNANARGFLTWRHILDEEVAEAFAESDPEKLQLELIQVAAVCLQWVKAIRRRTVGSK